LAKLHAEMNGAEFIVFDIETTGGNPEKNGITEIFAIRWGPQGVVDTFYSMVNPGVSIPPIVRRMTGITNAMVRGAPRIDEVMPKLLEFVKDDVFVSHNTIGDMKFLRYFAKEACSYELANFFLCTHLLVEKLAPEAPDKSLKGLAEYFKLATGELHRAEADAYVTLELFKVLLGKLRARTVKNIDEAVRLQGDLESGMRLGWGVDPSRLEGLPSGPGVFYLYDHERRLLFASSAMSLDRDVQKLATLSQLPRQLLRLVLKSYDLEVEETPNAVAAMLQECEVLSKHKLAFDPAQWHQRGLTALFLAERKDGVVLDVGPLVGGVKRAYGPVRDRKQAGDFLAKIGQALGVGPARGNVKVPPELEDLVIAYLDGRLGELRAATQRRKRSFKLWFKPSERKDVARRLDVMDQLLAATGRPKLESLLDKSGVLIAQDSRKGSWQVYNIVGGRPRGVTALHGEPSERLRAGGLAEQLAQTITQEAAAQGHGALSELEASCANTVLWWIYYGRNESRFIPLADLGAPPASASPQPRSGEPAVGRT
jgi:DNA polymerase III epsilon subunit family exonuclease